MSINLFDYPLELSEQAQRHRRNLLVASTLIGFIAAVPEVSLQDVSVFGLSLEDTPSNWVWGGAIAFIAYFLVTFWVDVSWCWSKWAVDAYPLFGGKLKGLFGFTISMPKIETPWFIDNKKVLLRHALTKEDEKNDTEETVNEAIKRFKSNEDRDYVNLYNFTSAYQNALNDKKETYLKDIPTLTISGLKTTPTDGLGVGISYLYTMLKKYRSHVITFCILQAGLPLGLGGLGIYFCYVVMIGQPVL